MKIGVSACLIGMNTKYNGGNNYSSKLAKLLKSYDIVPVCPEVLGGLPIPRDPAEIVDGEVLTREGMSVDDEFRIGARKAIDILKAEDIDFVILQSRSPSCGVGKIYDGSFTGRLTDGDGIFVRLLKEEGIKAIDVEEFINI